MTTWHASLEQRMTKFSRDRQLFMIANELNRAHHQDSNAREYKNSLERALELFDYHIQTLTQANLLKENLRLRNLIADYYLQPYQSTLPLQKALVQLDPKAWRQIGESFKKVSE